MRRWWEWQEKVTDVGVAGDVSNCISDRVHALSILMRNFNGKFFFNGKNDLCMCASARVKVPTTL